MARITSAAYAKSDPDPPQFFEMLVPAVLIEDVPRAMFTGYFEPDNLIAISLPVLTAIANPVYLLLPPDAKRITHGCRARDILRTLDVRRARLEIAYVERPVGASCSQISGGLRSDSGARRQLSARGLSCATATVPVIRPSNCAPLRSMIRIRSAAR